MKAILCKAWGEPEDLVLEDVTLPEPGPGEVKIAVHACGVNFADTLIIAGKYQEKPPFPFTPGGEIAGEVISIGEGVTHVQPGQRVAALCSTGGFAEEVIASAARTLPLSDAMDFVTGAGFIITYGTSHVALEHRAKLQAGETLLVHGAAGGVGLAAVDIGKTMGATVIATASTPEKLAVAQQYGADHLINYREEPEFRNTVKALTDGRGADVIYDPVGGDTFDQSLRCINWEGRILAIGFASGRIPQAPANILLVKNISIVGLYWGAYGRKDPKVMTSSLAKLMKWYAEGEIKPHVSQTYSLEQTADALRLLMNRKATGKVVLKVR
ncbi:MAG: NADPH:quinone oxidoreductase family protein [Chloroflexota bacterium]